MVNKERLFSEPKPEVCFPVDLEAEVKNKGKDALPFWEADGWIMKVFPNEGHFNRTVRVFIPPHSNQHPNPIPWDQVVRPFR